jgi:hypothetical protein
VGVSIFLRLVYQYKGIFIEVVIKKIYGVENSYVLYEWKVINGLKGGAVDFGYGLDYSYADRVLPLDSQAASTPNLTSEPAASPAAAPTVAARPCPPGSRREYFTSNCVVVF